MLYNKTLYNINSLVADIEKAICMLINTLEKIGLHLSESKSSVCLFNRSRKVINFNINGNGEPLRKLNKVKYLGLYLDSKLLRSVHIKVTCEKVYGLKDVPGVYILSIYANYTYPI